MIEHKYHIAEVAVPLAVKGTFQYLIPEEYHDIAVPGQRVIVQFGKKRIYTAIILEIVKADASYRGLKRILEFPDDHPIINSKQVQFFKWMADYYMAHIGEVIRAALPSGLKLNSESRLELIDKNWEDKLPELSDHAFEVLKVLNEKGHLNIAEVSSITALANPSRILKELAGHEIIAFYEQVIDKYRPKTIKKIRLLDEYNEEKVLEDLFSVLEKKEKQLEALMIYIREVRVLESPANNESGIANKTLIEKGASQSSISTLIKNGIFELYEEKQSRFPLRPEMDYTIELSKIQINAAKEIEEHWENEKVVLLKGITGSGKTEIYIEHIKRQLDKGKQCLLLLPEIALTTQIVERLQAVFSNELGVYHSRFSDNERVEIWENLNSGKYRVIIGVRSALFLPFSNLGLIVVDEEHDSSYKQKDPAPRYNARESAIILARLHNARVLLGSATPSMESFYLANSGKWALVELNQRFHEKAKLPQIQLVNFLDAQKKGQVKSIFTSSTVDTIRDHLEVGKQVIVFQNRRGYAPYLQCMNCGYIPMCHQCDVSLTLHQYLNQLRCHYCGFYEEPPKKCPRCQSAKFNMIGSGTEKIEEELRLLLPETAIQRMDLDTTRGKYAHQKILEDFKNQRIEILVGTQMLSKGLDFDNVELVVVVGADRMMFFPDFRSNERAFQTITQVSGRAGRKTGEGLVIIESNDPSHFVYDFIRHNDYLGFYNKEIQDREKFKYPPFFRMAKIITKSKDERLLEFESNKIGAALKEVFGNSRILGPDKPPVSRIRNFYIMEIWMKFERDQISTSAYRARIREVLDAYEKQSDNSAIRINIDIDPS